jgi:hypothetical protein
MNRHSQANAKCGQAHSAIVSRGASSIISIDGAKLTENVRQVFRWALRIAPCAAALLIVSPAPASETVSYGYDVFGRLVKVGRSGTVNNGATSCYAYDKTDNRSNVTVQTTSDCAAGVGVSFAISSNGAVTEGSSSQFTVTKAGTASGTLTVNYATSNGTALQPGDYTTTTGILTFLTGDVTKSINVPTINDASPESTETFTMTLSTPSGGATLSTPSATATINDDDGGGSTCAGISFSVSNASNDEGLPLNFVITKSGSTTATCSVNYATADGSARASADYTAASGSVSFTGSQTTQTVSITTIDDIKVEPDETVLLNLSSPTSPATISGGQGVGTIIDNETNFVAPPPPEGS